MIRKNARSCRLDEPRSWNSFNQLSPSMALRTAANFWLPKRLDPMSKSNWAPLEQKLTDLDRQWCFKRKFLQGNSIKSAVLRSSCLWKALLWRPGRQVLQSLGHFLRSFDAKYRWGDVHTMWARPPRVHSLYKWIPQQWDSLAGEVRFFSCTKLASVCWSFQGCWPSCQSVWQMLLKEKTHRWQAFGRAGWRQAWLQH